MTNLAAIVAAIFLAEGGTNAAVPYGILSVPVKRIQAYDNTKQETNLHAVRQPVSGRTLGTLPRVRREIQAHARQICERTVVNNWRRWSEAGRTNCFLDFLGDRYVPATCDRQGNVNWKRNVRAILNHQTCNCK